MFCMSFSYDIQVFYSVSISIVGATDSRTNLIHLLLLIDHVITSSRAHIKIILCAHQNILARTHIRLRKTLWIWTMWCAYPVHFLCLINFALLFNLCITYLNPFWTCTSFIFQVLPCFTTAMHYLICSCCNLIYSVLNTFHLSLTPEKCHRCRLRSCLP